LNPRLTSLQPYPFEKLRTLLGGVEPPALPPIRLSIGEPQHATPPLVRSAMVEHLDGLSSYPTTIGLDVLRESIAAWCGRRYALPGLDAKSQVLPVNGTREALFAFAQAVVDTSGPAPLVVSPNPFYQIYEGAALLAGAEPRFLNQTPDRGFALDLDSLSDDEWRRTQLLFVCSPGNPTGRVLTLDEWRTLFERADRHGFVIASDECYSEIYPGEQSAPLGGLEAAWRLGRQRWPNPVLGTGGPAAARRRRGAPRARARSRRGPLAFPGGLLIHLRPACGHASRPSVQGIGDGPGRW
jgi:N-succinyldiaminopimelate aminotransferase